MPGKWGIRNSAIGLLGAAACCLASTAVAADDSALCVRGSGDDAIAACTRAIKSGRFDRRNLAMIYSNRGLQWERKQDYDKAIKDHDEAIRLDPNYAAGFMHRGNTYARRGDFDRALADHSEGIRLTPKDADAFYNRGYTYSRKGDHERAIVDYSTGLELDASNSRLWGQRCWSRAVIGKQLQEAVEDCNKAQSLAPKIPQILGYRGFIHLKLGQFDKALADYDAAFALTTAPDNAEWLYGRGVAKARNGDTRGGNADIDRAKSIKADIAEDFAKYGFK
jgi:tetratricopeptide (TPR) repeat protein